MASDQKKSLPYVHLLHTMSHFPVSIIYKIDSHGCMYTKCARALLVICFGLYSILSSWTSPLLLNSNF